MVTEKKIKQIIKNNDKQKVTLTLPTQKVGTERRQNPIRFKNLLTLATDKLKATGMKEEEASGFLEPAKKLLGQPLFWSNMEHGMAVYVSEGYFEVFKLPYEIDEMAYVNDHFRITPLLPVISISGTFCILAISRKNIRLLRCTRTSVNDITPEDIPVSVEEWADEKPEQQIQFHTGNVEGEGAIYFGHGAAEEDFKEIVEEYFRDIEKRITKTMKKINDPLILAGLKTNIAMYQKANKYSRVLGDAIDYNPDELSNDRLRDKGWNIIQNHFLNELYKSIETCRENENALISNDLSEIITSTVMGKSATIFITRDLIRWGTYDEENNKVFYHDTPKDDDIDLINWLSIKGLESGSKVYLLPPEEMPIQSEVAALFRF